MTDFQIGPLPNGAREGTRATSRARRWISRVRRWLEIHDGWDLRVYVAGACILLTGFLLGACGSGAPYTGSDDNTAETPFAGVTSACDQFGNRVYYSANYGSISVSPHDPSCTTTGG